MNKLFAQTSCIPFISPSPLFPLPFIPPPLYSPQQTKGPATDRLHLNHRATPRCNFALICLAHYGVLTPMFSQAVTQMSSGPLMLLNASTIALCQVPRVAH